MLKNIKLARHAKTIAILATFLAFFTGMAKAYDVSAANIKITDNNNSYNVKTNADTVSELLKDEEVSLNKFDTINVDVNDKLKDNMEIVIKRAFFVNVVVDGKDPIKVRTNQETVGKVVSDLRKEHGTEYILESGSSSFKAEPNMTIKINSVKETVETKKEEVPFETRVVETEDLEVGEEKVSVQGENGISETDVKTIYVGGRVSSIEDGETKIVKEPIEKVILKGIREPEPVVPTVSTNKGEFEIIKEFSMKATAYTEMGNNITASGMRAAVGVVAVDPRVIPLGSKLYIEGYGYAIAGDTGGAIKNNRIDLYFNTERECVNYGVKNNIKVYLLGNQM